MRQGERLVGKMVAIMLNFVLKTLHECDRCSVVAVHFFSFVVGFLCGVSFICRALGWLLPIVQALPCLSIQAVLSSWLGQSAPPAFLIARPAC